MTPEIRNLLDSLASKSDDHASLLRELSETQDIIEASDILKRNGYDVSEDDLRLYVSENQSNTRISDGHLDEIAGAGIRPNDGCFGFNPNFWR